QRCLVGSEMCIRDRQGRDNEARRRMTRLVERGTATAQVLARLAQMRWDDRQTDEAMALSMAAVGRNPGDESVSRWTAARWKEEGRIDLALGLFRRAAALPAPDGEARFQVAFLSQLLGDEAGATQGYLELLRDLPDHPQGNYNLSLLRLAEADTLGAIDCLERTIRAGATVPQAFLDLALLYMGRKDLPDARRVLLLYRTDASPDSTSDAEVQELLRSLSR
ncbi:MAG: hypothetical protein QUU85_09075, partial [Candidatus Eisenbacteria bacterium]|nr:hypothetical protein [Candidatus Eisenbacteria bacterium]